MKNQDTSSTTDSEANALLKEFQERIDSGTKKWEEPFKELRRLRRYISGRSEKRESTDSLDDDSRKQMEQANIVFATLQGMLPHLYAKDPDVVCRPATHVDPTTESYSMARKFSDTLELVTSRSLKDANLKQVAKSSIREGQISSVAMVKVGYQEDYYRDPIIGDRITDLQAKLAAVRGTRQDIDSPDNDSDETQASIETMTDQIKAMEQKVDILRAEGLVIDQFPIEDFRMDDQVDTLYRYREARWMAHCTWMPRKKARDQFNLSDEQLDDINVYRRNLSGIPERMGKDIESTADHPEDLKNKPEVLPIWEMWDRESNTVYTWGEGAKDWCKPSWQPTRMGKRWYPFFLLAFNWLDNSNEWPVSDVALLENLGREYDTIRKQGFAHRKLSKPHFLTDSSRVTDARDVETFTVAELGEVTAVNAGGIPIGDFIVAAKPPPYNPAVYDTSQIRTDMEWMSGLGDAQRGGVLRSKTATEANIQQNGLNARVDEKRDSLEDWLSDISIFAAELLIQSMSLDTVHRIAGENAFWPQVTKEELYTMVEIDIRAGSTGKPDKERELARWVEIAPMIENNIQQIMQMRAEGVPDKENPYVQMLLETLRRTDEKIDLEKFLPGDPVEAEESADPGRVGQVGPSGNDPNEAQNGQGGQPGQPSPEEVQAQMQVQAQQQEMRSKQLAQQNAAQTAHLDIQAKQMKLRDDELKARLEQQAIQQRIDQDAEMHRAKMAKLTADTTMSVMSGKAKIEADQDKSDMALMGMDSKRDCDERKSDADIEAKHAKVNENSTEA